jgi:hypothetical protein
MHITMEIAEPFERKGDDVIVNITKRIIDAGASPRTEHLFLRQKNHADASDKEIEQLAWSAIMEHLEKIPEDR